MTTNGMQQALCPICQGCGRVSRDLLGKPIPQPSWVSAGTDSTDGPEVCPRCGGSGAIVIRPEQIGAIP